MSNISSNSLFHFTPKLDYLLSIIENGFYPRHCIENVKLSSEKPREGLGQIIPRVCFCDISLSQIEQHINTYGNYGIGMTKEWGIKNKLNPVIYLNTNSKLANSISQLTESIYQLLDKNCNEHSSSASDELMSIFKFIKPYETSGFKNEKKELRFYNEKEWRYVPEMPFDVQVKTTMELHDFDKPDIVADFNKKLEDYKLQFSAADIKYIFISNYSEIHTLITELKKSNQFSQSEIEVLTTKILTIEQIKDDF